MSNRFAAWIFVALVCLSGLAHAGEIDDLRERAEQGNASAQSDLGLAYYKGEGVPEDYVEALKWLRKAADQGDAMAQANLGRAYYLGEGVT